MIDDLNMSAKDKFGDSSTLELLRQWMDHGKWYNHPALYLKQIKEISFCATLTTHVKASQISSKEMLDERCSWHWIGIGMTNSEGCLD